MRYRMNFYFLSVLIVLLAACDAPRSLPVGPTPIPTLIPATEPANLASTEATPSFTILSFPARPPSADQGKRLYGPMCAKCHGEFGNAIVPGARNFTDLDFMRGETPASFYTTVTEGRGEMPAFLDMLTSDARWDVVFYMWTFSTSANTLAVGKNIYETNCTACHGSDGVGKVLGASDFTDLRYLSDRAPRDFYLVLTQGKGSMPAWQGRLSQDERWAVIDYLRTFSYDAGLEQVITQTQELVPTTEAASTEVVSTEVVSTEAVPSEDVSSKISCDPTYLNQSNPFAWEDANAISAGSSIYNESCSMCHSDDGTGLIPGMPDLTKPETQDKLRNQSSEFLCITAEGFASMPGWKDVYSDEQMWQVLTFISTFNKP